MIFDDYFMVLPVYRITQEAYLSSMDSHIQKEMYSTTKNIDFYKTNLRLREQHEGLLRCLYGGPWEFNEVIGFIKLFFYGSQVRGEYWAVQSKRIVKSRRKQFEYKTHKLHAERRIREKSNNHILESVREYIEGCKNELPRRHIDTREFEALSPHINWVSLYEENNQFI